ncbi:MAG: sodium-dependent transporter [Puniceicoccales bacterium]|jgi:NSS family neurotransmitter:Na+ symporter|nr:sodium-dependent transporter [Puniceicoccales bacterium]
MSRSHWGSRLGFILAAAGSAIGLGAVWKFPYVTANNGGGAFLVIYLAICLTLGLALMVTEMALGRAANADAVGIFKKLKGGKWPIVGYAAVLTCFLILSFYCSVGGWTVAYIVKSVPGGILTSDAEVLKANFDGFLNSPILLVVYLVVFSGITLGVVIGGVKGGIETLSKYLMPALFVLMVVLIVRGLTLPGAVEGVRYFLQPDFSKVTMRMVVDALGLAFFSLSLGMGIMLTYGSYVEKGINLLRSSLWVIALTVGTSFLAGLMVLPAMIAFGLSPQQGPGLTFVTMPAVFAQLPAGEVFSVMFFVLLLLAALTSSVSLLEVIVCFLIDEFGLGRRTAAVCTTLAFVVLGVAVSWSMGPLRGYTVYGKNLFDILDFLTLNLMMPLVEIAVAIFAGWVVKKRLEAELLLNGTKPFWLFPMMVFVRFIAPVLIALILVNGLIEALKPAG